MRNLHCLIDAGALLGHAQLGMNELVQRRGRTNERVRFLLILLMGAAISFPLCSGTPDVHTLCLDKPLLLQCS